MAIDRSLSDVGQEYIPVITDGVSQLQSSVSLPDRPAAVDNSNWDFKYGGVVIAVIGFALTRLTVLPVIHHDVPLLHFLAGDILPLVLGLGITIVGLGLAISTLPRIYVNSVATWCLLGTVGMALVAGVVVVQVTLYIGMPALRGVWASSLVANTLLAGAIGGILIGVKSARNHQHRRDLQQQSRQATVLNRLLRHEVLNKLGVIQGYTTQLLDEETPTPHTALQRINRSSNKIRAVIDDVGFLTRGGPGTEPGLEEVRLNGVIDDEVAAIRRDYPQAEVNVDPLPGEPIRLRADANLHRVLSHLFENAIHHNDSSPPRIDVSVRTDQRYVKIRIRDNGPGLPDDQQALLENGTLPTYDDPSTGFGLSLVRILVSQYRGTIDVTTDLGDSSGTAITITLPRIVASSADRLSDTDTNPTGITPRQLGYTALAALAAGVAMGTVLYGLTNTLPAIGGLYGAESFGVGWVLHLFHSVVFGLVFAVVVSRTTRMADPTIGQYTSLGLVYGIILWAGAAGIVMPMWLNLVGIPSSIPFLTLSSLFGHSVWGVSLGALYGYLNP